MTETIELDWRTFDRAALDRAFNNGAAVPDSSAIVAAWDAESAEMRRRYPDNLDLAYGSQPRNRIDFLSAGANTPTLVFIHGGYWQARSKETFTFLAAGPLAIGVSVAFVGYTLAPDASLDQIVAEIRQALDWLANELPRLGGDPAKVWTAGWSAGGHLVASTLDHPLVRGGLAISGIYDLEPIMHCYVNDKLRLDSESAMRNSPIRHLPSAGPPLAMTVGGGELPLLRQQSAAFAAARAGAGLPGRFEELPGHDHFSIMDEFRDSQGALTRMVAALCRDH